MCFPMGNWMPTAILPFTFLVHELSSFFHVVPFHSITGSHVQTTMSITDSSGASLGYWGRKFCLGDLLVDVEQEICCHALGRELCPIT